MKKQILIVDDAMLMRNIIRDALSSFEEYQILEAQNGQDGVTLYKKHNPTLVTMDITMDVLNGIDAAKNILEYDEDARIIMITALGQERLLNECIEVGVCDYIVKPFTTARIINSIQKALSPKPAIPAIA